MDPNAIPPNNPQSTGGESFVRAEVVPQPVRPVPRAKSSGWRVFGWLGFFLLLAVLGISLLANLQVFDQFAGSDEPKVEEKYHSLNRRGADKVAIIKIEGTILEQNGFIKRQIDHVGDDEDVKAVVLRIDSPGGTVTGSDYLFHHLKKLAEQSQIPIVVSMGGIAASGGYYVAMAVGETKDTIFAEPTTWTGSIGVIIPHYNVGGLMDEWHIQDDSIQSHPLKGMGSLTRAMTEDERKIFEGLVADGFSRFKEVVSYGRPAFKNDPAALDQVATGQVFTTKQALANGLVDREGFLEDAIDRAIELAGLDPNEVRVVSYGQRTGLMDQLLFGPSGQTNPFNLESLLNLTTPRAYYLWTWPAISSPR